MTFTVVGCWPYFGVFVDGPGDLIEAQGSYELCISAYLSRALPGGAALKFPAAALGPLSPWQVRPRDVGEEEGLSVQESL